MPLTLGVLCFVGVFSYRTTHYVETLAEAYEVLILPVFFMLFLSLLVPTTDWHAQLSFFSSPSHGGYQNFRMTYIKIFQIVPGRVLTTIAGLVLTATSCRRGDGYKKGHMIIPIINVIQLVITVTGIIPFLRRNGRNLKLVDPQILSKLLAVKIVIMVQVFYGLIMSILTAANVLNPTRTMSYNDLNLGLSVFVTVLLAFISSMAMIPFYRPRQFQKRPAVELSGKSIDMEGAKIDNEGNFILGNTAILPEEKAKRSALRAVLDAFNFGDVILCVWRAFQLLTQGRR